MRSRRLQRCENCGLSESLCVCALMPRLVPETRIMLVSHRTELVKSTNTAKLVVRMLEGASLRTRGDLVQAEPVLPPMGSFVLFPSADAILLPAAMAAGLRHLVVPDGTWTQAKRIVRRDPICRDLIHVRLEAPPPSAYHLRRNLRDGGLCTLEAIAEALRVIEGNAIPDAMLALFHIWVARSQRVRAGDHEKL